MGRSDWVRTWRPGQYEEVTPRVEVWPLEMGVMTLLPPGLAIGGELTQSVHKRLDDFWTEYNYVTCQVQYSDRILRYRSRTRCLLIRPKCRITDKPYNKIYIIYSRLATDHVTNHVTMATVRGLQGRTQGGGGPWPPLHPNLHPQA